MTLSRTVTSFVLMMQVSVGGLAKHALGPEIERVTQEQLRYALLEAGVGSQWNLFAEEGEMKLYKREEIVDGMVMDPLKAIHSVRGVTGHEMCHYFFDPSVRMEWESMFSFLVNFKQLNH